MHRHFEVARKGDRSQRMPAKQKAWRHEDDLKLAVGKTLVLYGHAEWSVVGTLVNFDQYTIQLAVPKHDNSVFTYYKSALLGFRIEG